jgi:hypothetical protein
MFADIRRPLVMKIAIMQPYFFPYIGYFSLIKHTDKFILFDVVQFIYHGWIERNRILKQSGGWQYVRVPLQKHSRETIIKDIVIDNGHAWKEKIIAQLQHYRKTAPYYLTVNELIMEGLSQKYTSIVNLNLNALKCVCEYLNIHTPLEIFSAIGLEIGSVRAPDEWALNICRAMKGVTEYWNPMGGKDIFDKSKYEANQIKLCFHKTNVTEYNQTRPAFEAGLSIIDVLMFNSVEQVNKMLDNYELF